MSFKPSLDGDTKPGVIGTNTNQTSTNQFTSVAGTVTSTKESNKPQPLSKTATTPGR